jgi:hypothetical protein
MWWLPKIRRQSDKPLKSLKKPGTAVVALENRREHRKPLENQEIRSRWCACLSIAASGHSAYAQTPLRDGVEAFFCGRAFNAPSQKVAEERALENCRSVGKRYKVKIAGACAIYVSK